MRVAVISDIHSNIYALEAVLEDIATRNIDRIFCAGDLVGYTPYPNEVIEKIRSKEIPTVQGNYDEAVGNEKAVCGCDHETERGQKIAGASMNFTVVETSEENKKFLRELPEQLEFNLGEYEVLLVHGSPRRLNEYLYAGSEQIEEVLAEVDADILVCGHTHLPYHRLIAGQHVINVGSVGKPKHGNPNSIYTIIEVDKGQVTTEFIEVSYPVEKVTAEIGKTALADEVIEDLRSGRG
jgi:putative phosphoesterase